MFIDNSTSREELELIIINEQALYASFDEDRLLNDGYSTDELRAAITAWIEAGDECRAC